MPDKPEVLPHRSNAARNDDRDDEAQRLAEAAEHARKDEDRAALSDSTAALGRLARDAGELERALQLYEQAARIAREAHDMLRVAHRLRHLGDIHHDAGRLERARACYEEALSLYRSRPDPPALDLANLLRPLAMLEERSGGTTRSAELWAEAGTLYAEAKVEAGVHESAQRLARLLSR